MREPHLTYFAASYRRELSTRMQDEYDDQYYDLEDFWKLSAALHAQLQQFLLGLETLPFDWNHDGVPLHSRIKRVANEIADSQIDDNYEVEVGEALDYAARLAEVLEFESWFSAAYAVDGSVALVAGPDLPASEEFGIKGGGEHTEEDLGRAIDAVGMATNALAALRTYLERPDEDFDEPAAAIRVATMTLNGSSVGRLWTDDDIHFGFLIDDQSGVAGLRSGTIADLVHRVRLRGATNVSEQFDALLLAVERMSDLESVISSQPTPPTASGEPGAAGGPQSFEQTYDDGDASSILGVSMVENSIVYVRENGRWVEPEGADDERYYGAFTDADSSAVADFDRQEVKMPRSQRSVEFETEDLDALANPQTTPIDIRELLVLKLRAEFGFACEIRGDNNYAILLEGAPDVRISVSADRLIAFALFAEVPSDLQTRTRILERLNSTVDVKPLELSVQLGHIAMTVSLLLRNPISEAEQQGVTNLFTANVRILSAKVQAIYSAVTACIEAFAKEDRA